MAANRFTRMIGAAVVGSLSFWLPMTMARALFAADWGTLLILFPLTLCLPAFLCLVLEAFTLKWQKPRPAFAFGMLLGIWGSGPFWIMLMNTSAPGEGFLMAGSWSSLGFMTATFPFSTFALSTYNGSLLALLLTTIAVLTFAVTHWSFRQIATRCIVCRSALPR